MKQITEDYVSYETAKLLKEKGFDELSTVFYNEDGTDLIELYDYEPLRNSEISGYARITQSLALKWLREVHKIFVEPFVAIDLNGKYHYSFRLLNSICKDILEPKDLRNDFKDTYEQAVEAACLYILKNLI